MEPQHESKTKLLEATLRLPVPRATTPRGSKTSAPKPGMTKGSFFHHFKSKEDLALAETSDCKRPRLDRGVRRRALS